MRRTILLAVAVVCMVAWCTAQPTPIFEAVWPSGSNDPLFTEAQENTSGPVVYDLDGDGQQEIILTGRRDIWVLNMTHHDPSNNDYVFHEQAEQGYEFCSPATVAHLSSDGHPWIIVGGSDTVDHDGGVYPKNWTVWSVTLGHRDRFGLVGFV